MPRAEWIRPGAHEVIPGVHRIPLPLPNDGLRAVNVYALHDGARLTLVDGGWALEESREQLRDALRTIGADLGDIGDFLVTHVHRDHYTQAVALRGEYGSRVRLGVGERPTLRGIMSAEHAPMETQLDELIECGAKTVVDALVSEFSGSTGSAKSYWQEPDEWIDESSRFTSPADRLRVVETPGHTRGHVVFLDEPNELMFAGDHVLPNITPSIALEHAPPELPLRDYLGSLERVRGMPDMRLLPAHGPVTDSVHRRVDELLDHHGHRLELFAEIVAAGASTAYEVARASSWTRHDYTLDELDPFNRTLAILETSAHLKLLVHQNRLRGQHIDGVLHYADG